jgi:hypothetical protein
VRAFGATRLELTGDVLNVLDRGNVLDYTFRPAPLAEGGFVRQPRRMLGLHPVISLRLSR